MPLIPQSSASTSDEQSPTRCGKQYKTNRQTEPVSLIPEGPLSGSSLVRCAEGTWDPGVHGELWVEEEEPPWELSDAVAPEL